MFASPGPIYDPQGDKRDFWGFARALFAAGFREGELVHNTFSYHFTPAGFMMDLAAQAIGCPVFPAGVGQTELQVQTIADLKPICYAGTPSFLKIILEKADEMGKDVSQPQEAPAWAAKRFCPVCGRCWRTAASRAINPTAPPIWA